MENHVFDYKEVTDRFTEIHNQNCMYEEGKFTEAL